MTGGAHFNEVFFDDVRVPAENLVGDLHDGWTVARTTLMNERFAAGALGSSRRAAAFAAGSARPGERRARPDPLVRQRARRGLHAGPGVRPHHRPGAQRPRARRHPRHRGLDPQAGDRAILGTRQAELALSLLGARGTLMGDWQAAFLGAPAVHIGGGTDEIQRNIIGEQVLGLPREPSADRGVPFRDLGVS